MGIGDLASLAALIISAFALWRTRSSLSIYRDKHDDITITNDSPHAVTLVEIGLIGLNGRLDTDEWKFDERINTLPHRLDAYDTVTFKPSLDTIISRAYYGHDGTYVRMASGQLFGSKGRAFSDIGVFRWWWRRAINFFQEKKSSKE